MAADPVVAPPRPRAPQRPRLRPAPPPRRVSGPAGGSAASRSAARTAARTGRAAVAPRGARSVSAGTVALPAPNAPLHKVLEALRALPDARWLDRLLRGQGWIVLIGIALMGIVAMQVSLLKMNAGIGQSIERAGALERQNADLRAEVSKLSSEERIAAVATKNGLVMPDAGEVRYVRVRGEADARRAAAVMRAPDPADTTATTSAAATAGVTTTTTDPAATTTADPAAATAPSTSTTSATPPADATDPTTATPPAQTQPTTPAPGTTAGATQAPTGTTAAPGQ